MSLLSLSTIPLDISDPTRLNTMEAWRKESSMINFADIIRFLIEKEGFLESPKSDFQQISVGYGTKYSGSNLSREEALEELVNHLCESIRILYQVTNFKQESGTLPQLVNRYLSLALDHGSSHDFIITQLSQIACFRRDGLILDLAYNAGVGLAQTMITTATDPIEYYRSIVFVTENGVSRKEDGLVTRRKEGLEVFNV